MFLQLNTGTCLSNGQMKGKNNLPHLSLNQGIANVTKLEVKNKQFWVLSFDLLHWFHTVQLLLIAWQIFGNSPSGGTVLHYLLEWVQNGHAERYIKGVLQHLQPYNSPSYWPAVSNVFSFLTRVMLIHLNSICCWDFTNKAFCFPLRSTVWFSKVVLMMCVNCLLSILTDKQENMMLVYLSIHWRNLTSLVSKDIESEKEI